MGIQKIAGILLIVAGALALGYGGFTYTNDTHEANLGPVHLSVAEKERVNVPVWAGVGSVLIGGLLLLAVGRRAGPA